MDHLLVKKRGQTTLELALVFIVLILFLLGAVKTMLWFGNNLGGRAKSYSATRPNVIGDPSKLYGIGYQQTKLSLFND